MTEQEYKKQLLQLEKEFKQKKHELDLNFATANNTVQIGDIVEDGNKIIRVEKFRLTKHYTTKLPYFYYEGIKLTKKLEPFKSGVKECVFPDNTKFHIIAKKEE